MRIARYCCCGDDNNLYLNREATSQTKNAEYVYELIGIPHKFCKVIQFKYFKSEQHPIGNDDQWVIIFVIATEIIFLAYFLSLLLTVSLNDCVSTAGCPAPLSPLQL